MKASFRTSLGCWLHERRQLECALSPILRALTGVRWQDLCNRNERLDAGDDPSSRECRWADSSVLTVARTFPRAGGRLLAHCFAEWPLDLATAPRRAEGDPEISIILPIGGAERRGTFPAVLKSFLGQAGVRMELLVVEHAVTPLFRGLCPEGTTHVHVARASAGGFNKGACFNEGVRRARAPAVLLHDADAVVPRDYARSVLDRMARGFDAVRAIRFLFYLDAAATDAFVTSGAWPSAIEVVQQNGPGLSTAVRRETYGKLGGHDERFEGWGGEDLEFLDRLKTCKLFCGAYAPALHLWHSAAPKKASGDRNFDLLARLRSQPPHVRIQHLLETG